MGQVHLHLLMIIITRRGGGVVGAILSAEDGLSHLGGLWENRSYPSSFQWVQAKRSFIENRSLNYHHSHSSKEALPPSLYPGFFAYTSPFISVFDYLSPGQPLHIALTASKEAGGSQVCQDFFVASLLDGKRNGFFVDIAANHWEELSNTLWLENMFQYKGICVEPNPDYRDGILANRRCVLIMNPVSTTSGEIVHFLANIGPVGGIVANDTDNKPSAAGQQKNDGGVDYETVSLLSILDSLDAPRVIEYLSLDVEGSEYHILKSFDFEKYKFLIMTVERPTKPLHQLLFNNGYHFLVALSSWGEIVYVHETLPNFNKTMAHYRRNKNKITIIHDTKSDRMKPYVYWYNPYSVKRDCINREASFGWNRSLIRGKKADWGRLIYH